MTSWDRRRPGQGQQRRTWHDRDHRTLRPRQQYGASLHGRVDRRHFVFAQPEYVAYVSEGGFFDPENHLCSGGRHERPSEIGADEILHLLRAHPHAGPVLSSLSNQLTENFTCVRIDGDPMGLVDNDYQTPMLPPERGKNRREYQRKSRREVRRVGEREFAKTD
jgi:hypothetical protein